LIRKVFFSKSKSSAVKASSSPRRMPRQYKISNA